MFRGSGAIRKIGEQVKSLGLGTNALVVCGRNTTELEEVLRFCVDVSLPVTLGQIAVNEVTEEKIRNVAKMSCVEGETIHNMPFVVTADKVYNAILAADAIGKRFLRASF